METPSPPPREVQDFVLIQNSNRHLQNLKIDHWLEKNFRNWINTKINKGERQNSELKIKPKASP